MNILFLGNNGISEISTLSGLNQLTYLYLENNNITTGVADLVTLTNAEYIFLYHNPGIPSEELATLVNALGVDMVKY